MLGATAHEPEDKLSYLLESLVAGSDLDCKQYNGDCEACTSAGCAFIKAPVVMGRRELKEIKWPGLCLDLPLPQGRRMLTSPAIQFPIFSPQSCPYVPLPPKPQKKCEDYSNCYACVVKGCVYSYPLMKDGTSKGICAEDALVGGRRELTSPTRETRYDFSVCKKKQKKCGDYSNCYVCVQKGCVYSYPLMEDGTTKGICAEGHVVGGRRELTSPVRKKRWKFSVCKMKQKKCGDYSNCYVCVQKGCVYSYPLMEDGTTKGICAEGHVVGGRRELTSPVRKKRWDFSVCKIKPLPFPFGPGPVIPDRLYGR